MELDDRVLSVEFFAAKDQFGVMMSVPCKCGLRQADTLRVDGLSMVAMRERSILPIDLPPLTDISRNRLVALAARGKSLPVGEFMARGLFDSYYLGLLIV